MDEHEEDLHHHENEEGNASWPIDYQLAIPKKGLLYRVSLTVPHGEEISRLLAWVTSPNRPLENTPLFAPLFTTPFVETPRHKDQGTVTGLIYSTALPLVGFKQPIEIPLFRFCERPIPLEFNQIAFPRPITNSEHTVSPLSKPSLFNYLPFLFAARNIVTRARVES